MKNYKTFNEVKVGDTLYCLSYDLENHNKISIVPLTVKKIITNDPIVERKMYLKEAIVIEEKVPNSQERAGEFVIDQYDGSNQSQKYGIFTTYEEARLATIEELMNKFKANEKEIKALHVKQKNIIDSLANLI